MCAEYEQHRPALKAWARLLADWPDATGAERRHCFPHRPAFTVDAHGFRTRYWSLIPAWLPEPRLRFSSFNARAETLRDKPVFRDAWRRGQRCLVPASAWYEWQRSDGRKRKFRIAATDGSPLVFAGLWSRWHRDGHEPIDSFTIVTTEATPSLSKIHHRMPRLLTPNEALRWLHEEPETCADLLQPPPDTPLRIDAVAPRPETASQC